MSYENIERITTEILAFVNGGKYCQTHWHGKDFFAIRDGNGVTIRAGMTKFWASEDCIERVFAHVFELQAEGLDVRPKHLVGVSHATYVLGILATMRGQEPVAVERRRLLEENRKRRGFDLGTEAKGAPTTAEAADPAAVS